MHTYIFLHPHITNRSLVKQLGDCHYHLSVEKTIIDVYSLILMDTFQYLTVGVTVMLAVERYIAICHPMRAMTMCTVRRARTIICILTIIAFTLRAPKFFELDIGYVHISTGEAIFMVTRVYLYDEFLYTCIVTAGLLTILPLLSLMILNIRIIYEIRHSARYLRNFLGADLQVRSVVSSEELKITMMLISVVIAFFICHAPYMVFTLIMAFAEFNTEKNPELTNSEFTKYFKYVCTSLLILKASCNFILYCWFSEKFWATYKRIFCPMLCVSQQRSARRYPHSSNNNNHRSMWQQSSTTNFHRSSYYVTRETTC
ncbi:FMRFamide receptor-like [Aplysia californica]|uniref:FMRFamide receptor-like n=1 Tax=Aplysia californica TaxID=6500 RepID=A0ABM1A061_APLCA|nr:FMRFamide receptor-like [Aplysia californica]